MSEISQLKTITRLIRRNWKTILPLILASLATLLLSAIISTWLSSYYNSGLPSIGIIRVIDIEGVGEYFHTAEA